MVDTYAPDTSATPPESLLGTLRGHDFAVFSQRSVDPRIHLLQSEIAPINAVLRNIGKAERVTQVKHEWPERETLPHTTTANGSFSDSDLTLEVVDIQLASVGAFVLLQDTRELCGPIVSVDRPNDQFTIETGGRGRLGTTAQAIADGAVVVFQRGTIAEGANAATPIVTQPVMKYNYVEPLSTTYGVTDFLEESMQYANANKMSELRPLKMKDHMEEWEKRILYGIRGVDDSGARPYYFMGGLINQFIVTTIEQVTSDPETFVNTDLNRFIERLFSYNTSSARKLIFCDGNILRTLEDFKWEKMQLRPDDMMLNVAAFSYRSSFGRLDFIHQRFLNAKFGTAWTAVAIDPSNVKLRPYIRQTVRTGKPTNFSHEIMEEIYEVNTLQVNNEETCGIFQVRTTP